MPTLIYLWLVAARRVPNPGQTLIMATLRSLSGGAVREILAAGLRSVVAVETLLVAVLFHDEFGRTEDS